MSEHGFAQIRDQALAEGHHQIEAHPSRGGEGDGECDDGRETGVEQMGIAASEAGIDHVLEALSEREHTAGRDEQCNERGRDPSAIRLYEAAKAEKLGNFSRRRRNEGRRTRYFATSTKAIAPASATHSNIVFPQVEPPRVAAKL